MDLRPATPDDAPRLLALRAEPGAARWLAVRDEDEAALRAELAQASELGGRLVVEQDSVVAGVLAWRVTNRRSRIADLFDVVVAGEHRGRGLATRAVRAAARRLVAEHGIHRVQLETFTANTAARRAFERAGFVHEGTRRRAYWREGAWQDGALYGLLAEELEGQEQRQPVGGA